MPSYILRHIDESIWTPFKARAAQEGRGLKFVLLRLIHLYATVGLDALERAAKARSAGDVPPVTRSES